MRGLPDRCVIHVEVTADRAHDHSTGVQADANSDRDAFSPSRAIAVPSDRLLHHERRVARPHGVILVGNRRAEECHDPVAHDLVHRALVPVYRFHHPFENRVEKLPRLLGIAVGEQLHRALQVGEEYGDLLALAFQGGLEVRIFSARCLGV